MPSQEEIARFRAGENTWSKEQIATTERLNAALNAIQWVSDEPPKDKAGYESRIQQVTDAAEWCGYQAVRQDVPPHYNGTLTTLHAETLYVYNGPGNLVNTILLRSGKDFYGVINAEGWVRSEVQAKHAADSKKRRMARDSARQLEAMADADRAEDQTISSLVKRVAELESKLAGDA